MATRWRGDENVMIARSTDPWVQMPDGAIVNWKALSLPAKPGNECDTCCDSPVPGAIGAMNTDAGIERCDICDLFPGDLEAAVALAELVGGEVWFISADEAKRDKLGGKINKQFHYQRTLYATSKDPMDLFVSVEYLAGLLARQMRMDLPRMMVQVKAELELRVTAGEIRRWMDVYPSTRPGRASRADHYFLQA